MKMPEIESCRECAGCCHNCIFLSYNEQTDLFACLIYNNKLRVPIKPYNPYLHATDYAYVSEYMTDEGFARYLTEIIENPFGKPYAICHNFHCVNKVEEKYYNQFKLETIEDLKDVQKFIKENIPNFSTLVEILNSC